MPTGYTSKIYDGKEQTGKEFVMTCARAFGALMNMRDEPSDAVIPEEFKPSTYHSKQLELAREKLAECAKITLEEANVFIEEEHTKRINEDQQYYDKTMYLKYRYEKTLEQVEKWIPPTKEHIKLKEYAIDQLKQSIEFDCSNLYSEYDTTERYKKETPQEYIESKMSSCLENIKYHTEKLEAEIKGTNERNLWIKQLRDSL